MSVPSIPLEAFTTIGELAEELKAAKAALLENPSGETLTTFLCCMVTFLETEEERDNCIALIEGLSTGTIAPAPLLKRLFE